MAIDLGDEDETSDIIIESAGLTPWMLETNDGLVSYDITGKKYEVPFWILFDPANVVPDAPVPLHESHDASALPAGAASTEEASADAAASGAGASASEGPMSSLKVRLSIGGVRTLHTAYCILHTAYGTALRWSGARLHLNQHGVFYEFDFYLFVLVSHRTFTSRFPTAAPCCSSSAPCWLSRALMRRPSIGSAFYSADAFSPTRTRWRPRACRATRSCRS
jgi:hypothetical protein